MRRFELNPRYLLLPLHLILLLWLLSFVLGLSPSPTAVLLFIITEAIFLIAWAKGTKYAVYALQLQLFIMILYCLLFFPHQFLNIGRVSPTAVAVLALAMLLVEAMVTAITFLGERAIKRILKGSTISMILAVFLVFLLVGNEGIAGFMDGDPIEMLTTSQWTTIYNPGVTATDTIEVEVRPFEFALSAEDAIIHMLPYSVLNSSIMVENRGALNDTFRLTSVTTGGVTTFIDEPEVMVSSGQKASVPVCFESAGEGSYSVIIEGRNTNGDARQVTIELEVVTQGGDLSPSQGELYASDGERALLVTHPLQVRNVGSVEQSYILRVLSSDAFIPQIYGEDADDVSWDYTTGEGRVTLLPHEVMNLTMKPRMVQSLDGTHELTVEMLDGSRDLIERSVMHMTYINNKMLRNEWQGAIPIHSTASAGWNITLSAIGVPSLNIEFMNIPDWLSVRAFVNGTEEIPVDQVGEIKMINGSAVVTLMITSFGSSVGDTASFDIVVTEEGLQQKSGMFTFILGTAITTSLALIVAVPLALGCAIFLAEYCPRRIRNAIKPVMEVLSGIPSVVYGLWGALTLGPLLSSTLYPLISDTLGRIIPFFYMTSSVASRSIMTASIMLAFMILPIIMVLSYDAISAVPRDLRDASTATGASRWQTIRKVVLRKARSGIIASILLGTGRAMGETMAVLMVMGAGSTIPGSVFDNMGTMTSIIAATFGYAFAYDPQRHALFSIALVLMILVFVLNVIVMRLARDEIANPVRAGKAIAYLKRRFAGIFPGWNSGGPGKQKKREPLRRLRSLLYRREDHTSSARLLRGDKLARSAFIVSAIIVLCIVAYIIGNVVVRGGLALDISFLLETERSNGREGGFLNAIVGSLAMVALAIGVAAPLSVLSAIYVNEYSMPTSLISRMALFSTTVLSSTPSIIFGAFGFMLFVFYLGFGTSLLAGGLTLAFMVIPLIFVSSVEALKAVPDSNREASLALGVSKWSTIRRLIFPLSVPSLSSGVIISIGRAIGETAAVMFTAGYATFLVRSIMDPVASMPNMIYIYYDISARFPEVEQKLYAVSFILITFVMGLNLLARGISRYYSNKGLGLRETKGRKEAPPEKRDERKRIRPGRLLEAKPRATDRRTPAPFRRDER